MQDPVLDYNERESAKKSIGNQNHSLKAVCETAPKVSDKVVLPPLLQKPSNTDEHLARNGITIWFSTK
jgi:hypothetical protein